MMKRWRYPFREEEERGKVRKDAQHQQTPSQRIQGGRKIWHVSANITVAEREKRKKPGKWIYLDHSGID